MGLNPASPPFPFRNAGPTWGYAFLQRADRWLPARVFDCMLGAGVWIAVACMPAERRNSREYLTVIRGRPPSWREMWRHFFSFTRMFMLRLRVAGGQAHVCREHPDCAEFRALMQSGRPALLGTFHFGNSDLLGFLLRDFQRHVYMIRLRMDNSRDTQHLAERFSENVTFIWVNESENLLFALKAAAQSGSSIALKCDRPAHSAKLEAFEFLGAWRQFPFTIYHLALVFRLPVVFCVSVPDGTQGSWVHGTPVFEPDAGSKEENLARARMHFQEVLRWFETLLRAHPDLWFNFTPLNPVVPAPACGASLPC